MKAWYIKSADYREYNAHIIDEDIMKQAEQGKNYLNPDDYDFLCDASSADEARKIHLDERSAMLNQEFGEWDHP